MLKKFDLLFESIMESKKVDKEEKRLFISLVEDIRDNKLDRLKELLQNKQIKNLQMKFIIKIDTNVSFKNSYHSLLHWAVLFQNVEVVKLLLKYGANPDGERHVGFRGTESPRTPLTLVLHSNNRNHEILKLLIDAGADINKEDALFTILSNGDDVSLNLFLNSKNLDINQKNHNSMTALSYEINNLCRLNVIQLLIDKGININAQDFYYYTPLIWAVIKNKKDIVELLLKHNANPLIKTKYDKTVLNFANDEMTKILEPYFNK